VVLRGHRTSISLERIFWDGLVAAAAADGMTVNALVARIDEMRSGNLSSAIRVWLMERAAARR
jgi:predicted DNA-binding ribbon-helix-helix protein